MIASEYVNPLYLSVLEKNPPTISNHKVIQYGRIRL